MSLCFYILVRYSVVLFVSFGSEIILIRLGLVEHVNGFKILFTNFHFPLRLRWEIFKYKESLTQWDCFEIIVKLGYSGLILLSRIMVIIYQVSTGELKNAAFPKSVGSNNWKRTSSVVSLIKLVVFKMSSTVFLLSWAATIATIGLFLSGMWVDVV